MNQTLPRLVLRREPIRILDTPADLLVEVSLGERAKEVLGYNGDTVEVAQRTIMAKLAAALNELGIEPFTNESVKAYRKCELWRAANIWQMMPVVFATCIMMFTLGLGVAAYMLPGSRSGSPEQYIGLLGGVLALFSLFGTTISAGVWLADGAIVGLEWKAIHIGMYNQPIPPAVLEMALEIKERCPEAMLTVEHLNKKTKIVPCGFFLRVDAGKKTFYVACWDEPRFDARVH